MQMLLSLSGTKPGSPGDAAIVIQNDLAIHMNVVSERLAFASAAVQNDAKWSPSNGNIRRYPIRYKGQSQACLVHVFAPGPLKTNALVQLCDLLLRT